MTPEELARDAMRVVDRVERTTTRALLEYLQLIERDVLGILRGLDLTDVTRSRAFRELRARDALTQSRAARELLSMGSATGPLAERFREGITQAYEDGIRSARDAAISTGIVTAREASMALGMGARVDLEFLVALSRANLTNLDRVGRGGLDRIEDALVRGSVRGAGPRATARMVREAVDITRGEAERIVRTVFANANSEARMSTYREMRVQYVQWDATNDDRTCSYCEARHGIVWKRDQAPRPPAHPNCLVGDTHVLAEGVTGYSKRWYEGPVVTITTGAGDRLTVTPNHPVLTPNGWVHAGLLNVGGHVVAHRVSERKGLGGLDDEHVEGRVEEVVDALAESPEMSARPVPTAPEHFHGDGGGSEVAVVGAYRHLWDGFDTARQQHVVQAAFLVAAEHALGLEALRLGGKRRLVYHPSAGRGVCLAHLPLALALGHLSPLDALSFGSRTRFDAEPPQAPVDDVAADAVAFRELVDARPAVEQTDEFIDGKGADAVVGQHAPGFENAADGLVVPPGDGRDLIGRLAGEVEFDEVVDLSVGQFAGHVYNLQTRRGWYVADGIVTHNCRCVLLPWREDSLARGDEYYLTTRRAMADRREDEGRAGSTATAAAPFDRANGTSVPPPAWAPGRGWLR